MKLTSQSSVMRNVNESDEMRKLRFELNEGNQKIKDLEFLLVERSD